MLSCGAVRGVPRRRVCASLSAHLANVSYAMFSARAYLVSTSDMSKPFFRGPQADSPAAYLDGLCGEIQGATSPPISILCASTKSGDAGTTFMRQQVPGVFYQRLCKEHRTIALMSPHT